MLAHYPEQQDISGQALVSKPVVFIDARLINPRRTLD